MKITKLDVENFETDGFLVVRNVFSKEKIHEMRNAFVNMRKKSKILGNFLTNPKYSDATWLLGDLASFPDLDSFDYLIFNKEIVEIVKSLIGGDIVYFGESNTQSGLAVRGNHKDSRMSDRENSAGLDWKGDYPLVRVGVYLHDSDIYSGGVKIMPKSHKVPTSKFKSGGINVDAKAGDLVIWKLTTTHSGNAKRFKYFHRLSLHPRIEDLIPAVFERRNPLERMALFVVYGAEGEHLERYMKYFGDRSDVKKMLRLAGISLTVSERAKLAGVKLVQPTEDYGAEANSSGFQFD